MTISLLTNGWICYKTITIIRKYILPLALQIRSKTSFTLQVENKSMRNLNLNSILNKNINLNLTNKNINVKKPNIIDINIDK